MEYEAVIGLEVHTELLTTSKMFCSCSTKFGERPNTNVCPVCLGLPGILPVINEKAVELAIKTGLALNCQINEKSRFARKNYFYPDLPKNYQISQFEEPIGHSGYLEICGRRIGINRVHLEEDAGKLIHPEEKDYSLVDFNRCGIPLLEIVTEPEITSPEEATSFLQDLKMILQYLEISDCNMEEGSLRCDANISVRKKGSNLGIKTEIKNLNSFKSVGKALSFEAKRQIEALSKKEDLIQETRLWDEKREITLPMRTKEESPDYRYFPDPDLPPLSINKSQLERATNEIPELPTIRKKRFIKEYNLPDYDASLLTSQKAMADYFEKSVSLLSEPKLISNWIMTELLAILKEKKVMIKDSPLKPESLVEIVELQKEGKVTGQIAKEIFRESFDTGERPIEILKRKGGTQISDEDLISKVIEELLKDKPKAVEDYKKGKEKAIGFLVGMVMSKTKGRANPQLVTRLLKEKLKTN